MRKIKYCKYFSMLMAKLHKKGKVNTAQLTLDVLGFALIVGGSILVRYSLAEQVSIVGGILVSIGVGLLALARTL